MNAEVLTARLLIAAATRKAQAERTPQPAQPATKA